jgi:transposase
MGARAPEGITCWTDKCLQWVKRRVSFAHHAQELTLSDYLHEVEHAAARIARLERSIDTAIQTLPLKMRAIIEALQSLRGVAQISAVSIVAEVDELSRHAPSLGSSAVDPQYRRTAAIRGFNIVSVYTVWRL